MEEIPLEYHMTFGPLNPNFRPNDPVVNELFVRGVRNHMNNVLMINGHVFLNDFLHALGFPRIREGSIGGWFWEDGSGVVKADYTAHDTGWLDLVITIDGVITSKLPTYEETFHGRI